MQKQKKRQVQVLHPPRSCMIQRPIQNGRRSDPGWKYGFWPVIGSQDLAQCSLCDRKVLEGIKRFKEHFAGGFGDVKKCAKTTTSIMKETIEESEEAIEGAYDKIITKSYSHRKKSRINLKSKLEKQVEESPSWVKALLGYFEVPSMDVISRRSLFGRISGWSIVTSAETGPTFQLALSLISCIYFLNNKMKSLVRVSTTGLVSRGENGSDSFRPIRMETDSDCLGSDFYRIIFGSETNSDFFVGNGNEYGRHAIRRIRIRIRIIRIRRSPDIRILAQKRKKDFN